MRRVTMSFGPPKTEPHRCRSSLQLGGQPEQSKQMAAKCKSEEAKEAKPTSFRLANQIGDAIMARGAGARRRRSRSGGRYATGARA